MASELHSRLEYLVNYSSQLIFVSGDSIAEQQRTLESFVFQQSDNTELAFITAEQGMQVTDYRGTLCKQLLGQVVGSYIRPLNELLAGLNHHDGPVLITITQAQYLPNSFLQELWDLVLQSRFANNKQHLNVLLFGESEWAEQAKEWLPAKNTNTPLLISSQSVSTQQYSSDVDKLLAERRAAFERYRQERGEAGARPLTDNRLRSPWLWIGVTLVFLSCFAAIMGWQYGATMTTLFDPLDSNEPATAQNSTDEPAALIKPSRTLSIVKQDSANAGEEQPLAEPAQPIAQPRVMASFNDAIKAIPVPANNQVANDKVTAEEPATVTALTEPSSAGESTTRDAQPQQVTASAEPVSSPAPPEEASSQAAPQKVSLNTGVVQLANEQLANSAAGQYWIQIAGMKDLELARDFLTDHQLTSQVTIYKTYRYGGDWYVILWSTPAASLPAAQQQLQALPQFPGSDKAFVKAGNQVKAEITSLP